MNYIQKCSIICLILILCNTSSVDVSAAPYYNVEPVDGHPFHCWNTSIANIWVTRWQSDKVIHMNYHVYMRFPDEVRDENEYQYSYRVESTLKISHTLDEQRSYINGDQYLRFDVRLLEVPEKHVIDLGKDPFSDTDIPEFDRISIYATLEDQETHVTSIYVLNCQYGLFLCNTTGEHAYYWLSEWEETHLRNLRIGIELAVFFVVCIIGLIIWFNRRSKVKKQIAAIQAASLSTAPDTPTDSQPSTDENGP